MTSRRPPNLTLQRPQKSKGGWFHGAVDFMAAFSDSFMALSTTDSSEATTPYPASSRSSSALSSPSTPTAVARNCSSPFVVVPRVPGVGKRSSLEVAEQDEDNAEGAGWCGLAKPFSMAKRQRGAFSSFVPLKF